MLISSIIILILFYFFSASGHDSYIRIEWHRQFNQLFWSGDIYPHWLPESFSSFGAPSFYFYSPLVFWLGALINPNNILGAEYSHRMLCVVGAILSAFTMSFYVKRYISDPKKIFMLSLLFAVHPYRVIDVVVRSALSEHFAFIFLPLVFLAIDIARDRDKDYFRKSILLSAFAFTGLILTNIPTFAITIFASGVYFFYGFSRIQTRQLLPIVLGGIAALFFTSFYLLPSLELRKDIMIGHIFDIMYAKNILVDIFGLNSKFVLILFLMIIVGFAEYIFLIRMKDPSVDGVDDRLSTLRSKWLVIVSIVFILQIPYLYVKIDKLVPFFQLIQFPWRWLILSVPFSIVVILLAWERGMIARVFQRVVVLFSISFIIILITLYFSYYVRPKIPVYLVWKEAPEYANKYVSRDPEIAYNTFRAHEKDAFILTDRIIDTTLGESIRFSQPQPNHYVIKSQLRTEASITLHQQYFPLWTLKSKNRSFSLKPDSIGRLTAMIPAGEEDMELYLTKPLSYPTGLVLSVSGLGILMFALLYRRRKREDS